MLAWHSVFYFVGYYAGKYKEGLIKHKRYIGLLLSCCWIILVPFWHRVDEPGFCGILYGMLNAKKIYGICMLYRYLVAFCGIGFVFSITYIISKNLKLKCVNQLGKNTLEIYVIHVLFFKIVTFENLYLKIILTILLGLSLPYMISRICHEGYISNILFGKK